MCIDTGQAQSQHWVRLSAVCYLGDARWLIADAGSGELIRIDTALVQQRISFAGQLREPVAVIRDGLSILCFDRTSHSIFRLNYRFELVSVTPLPDEYRNRFANLMAVTSFSEVVLIDRDRNELVAIDQFGHETWHIALPTQERVISMMSARDSLFVLFDSSNHNPRLLSVARFGAGESWIALPDSFSPVAMVTAANDSVLAISGSAVWNVREKTIPEPVADIPASLITASCSKSHLLLLTTESVRIIRWR